MAVNALQYPGKIDSQDAIGISSTLLKNKMLETQQGSWRGFVFLKKKIEVLPQPIGVMPSCKELFIYYFIHFVHLRQLPSANKGKTQTQIWVASPHQTLYTLPPHLIASHILWLEACVLMNKRARGVH